MAFFPPRKSGSEQQHPFKRTTSHTLLPAGEPLQVMEHRRHMRRAPASTAAEAITLEAGTQGAMTAQNLVAQGGRFPVIVTHTSADVPQQQLEYHPPPLQFNQQSVALNHWQDMLDADRNFESLPPHVVRKVCARNPEGGGGGGGGPVRRMGGAKDRSETPPSRKLSLDVHASLSSPSVNLTFCNPTTILTEEPPPSMGVSSALTQPQSPETGRQHSGRTTSSKHSDTRLLMTQRAHDDGQRPLILDEDAYLTPGTSTLIPPNLIPPNLFPPKPLYQFSSQLIATPAASGRKISLAGAANAQTSNYKAYRAGVQKSSRALTQTTATPMSPWDRCLSFSSDETAILNEARRVLFEGLRMHCRIAAECDCTTSLREKALEDMRRSLSVIQALPPLDSNYFIVD